MAQVVMLGDKKQVLPMVDEKRMDETAKPEGVFYTGQPKPLTYTEYLKFLKHEWRYVAWGFYSLSLMFGYGTDQTLSGLAIAYPAFRQDFGTYYAAADQYVVSALWQSLWSAGSFLGIIIGCIISGHLCDRVGRKILMVAALVLAIASSFALVFAKTLQVLFASKIIFGLAAGIEITACPLYAIENAPKELRGMMLVCLGIVLTCGQFVASVTSYGASTVAGSWSYKISFIVTFAVPAFDCLFIFWLPESPVYYIKRGNEVAARKTIPRLFGAHCDVDAKIGAIKADLGLDLEGSGEGGNVDDMSWRAIFSKKHRQRTVVSILASLITNFSGATFAIGYQTYFFELIGIKDAFGMTCVSYAIQVVANFVAVVVADMVPRRTIFVYGGMVLCAWNLVIGGASVPGPANQTANYVVLVFSILWTLVYSATIGSFAFLVTPEAPAQNARPKTLALATIISQACQFAFSFAIPYLLNPNEKNLLGKIMFIYAGINICFLVPEWFLMAETRGRSFHEIDLLYERKIPAWKTRKYVFEDEVYDRVYNSS